MTELNKRVEKALNGEVFDLQAQVYIEVAQVWVNVDYSLTVDDSKKLLDNLNMIDEANDYADMYKDDVDLSDELWGVVCDALNNHPYDEPLLGVVSCD